MARILVVDDDPDVRDLLETTLLLEGHEVHAARTGLEGLGRLRTNGYNVAVLDVDLPDLSGIGVAKAVRDFSTVPLVVCSAGIGWERAALDAGASACLGKPFPLRSLLELVRGLAPLASGAPPLADVRSLDAADLARIAHMSPEELDALPFGTIELAPDGRIVGFNHYESVASGRSRDAVIGRPFSEVAPCTLTRSFASAIVRAREGDRAGVLRYVFPRHGAASVVSVRFHEEQGKLWLFVSQAPAETAANGPAHSTAGL